MPITRHVLSDVHASRLRAKRHEIRDLVRRTVRPNKPGIKNFFASDHFSAGRTELHHKQAFHFLQLACQYRGVRSLKGCIAFINSITTPLLPCSRQHSSQLRPQYQGSLSPLQVRVRNRFRGPDGSLQRRSAVSRTTTDARSRRETDHAWRASDSGRRRPTTPDWPSSPGRRGRQGPNL